MALSANRTDFVIHMDDRSLRATPQVKNNSVIYYGALCSCDTDTGACKPFDGTSSDKLLGWHVDESVTGDTGAVIYPHAKLLIGPFRWKSCPVTGLAGTVADNGKRVYATDDETYTVLDPSPTGAEVGYIDNYVDATYADVIMVFVGGYVESFTLTADPTPTPSPTPSPSPTPTPTYRTPTPTPTPTPTQ